MWHTCFISTVHNICLTQTLAHFALCKTWGEGYVILAELTRLGMRDPYAHITVSDVWGDPWSAAERGRFYRKLAAVVAGIILLKYSTEQTLNLTKL